MRTSKAHIVLALVGLLFFHCGKKEIDVQGSVFIVTQGAGNYKLGLVKVTAIPENDINPFVENKKNLVSGEFNKSKTNIDSIKPEIEKYQKEYDEAKKGLDGITSQRDALKSKEAEVNAAFNPYALYESPFMSEYETPEQVTERNKQKQLQRQLNGIKKQISGFEPKIDRARKILSEAEQKLNQYKARLADIIVKIKAYLNAGFLLDGLPEGKIKTVTDAEGKFSLKLPRGKYALVASSHRRIVNTTEEYFWLVWIDLEKSESTQIILSNQNMLGQDSENSVFKYNELIPSIDNLKDPAVPDLNI